MKIILLITFSVLLNFKASAQKCSCDSICFCEILIQKLKQNWNERIKNADSIKLISIKEIGVIQTESNKQKYIELLTADTAWVAHPALGKKVFVDFLRYQDVQGKTIEFYDSTRRLIGSNVSFPKKEDALLKLYKSIKLSDRYYEVFFEVNGKLIMSPTICKTNQYICTGFLDNIISNLTNIMF